MEEVTTRTRLREKLIELSHVNHHEEMVTTTERDPREVATTVDPEMVHPEEAVIERTGPREESEAQGMTPPPLQTRNLPT